jgi:hypothetical protein
LEDLTTHSHTFYKERLKECEARLTDLNNQKNDFEKEFEIIQNRYRALITIESRLIDKGWYNEQDKHWFLYNCGLVKKEISTKGRELKILEYRINSILIEMEGLKKVV